MEIIPPGMACTSTPASTGSTFAVDAGWRFALSSLKYALIFVSAAVSRLVWKPSDSRITFTDSTGGCEENDESVDIAQSKHPAPASAAARYIAAAIPLVMWECIWMGIFGIAFLSAETSSRAAPGVRMPAMSLIASVSMPIASCCLASSTYFSTVWTGEVV